MGREELTEMYRALVAKFIMEETLRKEHGLEEIGYPDHLMKLEQILGIDQDAAQELYEDIDEELWEYTWHAYTEEWAWHRATEEAQKLIAAKKNMESLSLHELTEQLYEKNIERYASEIDMQETHADQKSKRKSRD